MSNSKEISILSKWLEEKLKEYFARKERRKLNFAPEDLHSFLSNQCNGVPIEVATSDFRILDLKIEMMGQEDGSNTNASLLDDNVDGPDEILKLPWRTDNEPYKQRKSRVYLVYQNDCQSVGKELHVVMCAAQVENLNSTADETIPRFILSLDEHQIDVYTQIFPILKEWALRKNVCGNLPVPECYYGSYETENEDISDSILFEGLRDDHIVSDGNDIMSKVAAGMKLFEREKREKENKKNNLGAPKQSSYRLLILEDIYRHGFRLRNVVDSTFLSLSNVKAALESLALIHCASWTFCVKMGKSFSKVWPFLNNPLYLPFLKGRVLTGYASMLRIAHDYLLRSSAVGNEIEASRILRCLIKLSYRITDILNGSRLAKTIKCLIHQDPSSLNFLFKYSMVDTSQQRKEPTTGWWSNRSNNNSSSSNNNSNSKENSAAKAMSCGKELRREVMIANWRTASYGSPMIDVAFLLMTALPPKTRRAETTSLLKIYWDTFRMHAERFGVGFKWSDKELYEDYLQSLIYTCVIITGNLDGISSKNLNLFETGMEVFIEAIKDLFVARAI